MTMNPSRLLELELLSKNNPTLAALLKTWKSGQLALEDWAHRSIIALANENAALKRELRRG
jgi:hypothetical protein